MSWTDPARHREAVAMVEACFEPGAERDKLLAGLQKLFDASAQVNDSGPFDDHSPPVHETISRFGGARR